MVHNNAIRLRRQIMIRICELFLENKLVEQIEHLPYQLRPRGDASTRCCVYCDREIIRYRCLAILGQDISQNDEPFSLSRKAEQALQQDNTPPDPWLKVLPEACASCVQKRYFVTNACRGCLARNCQTHCPAKAIDFTGGKAVIDSQRCINCGKCLQACPYHAVVYVPVPCEELCPAGAIRRSPDGKQFIREDLCIHCGKCIVGCPFGAVLDCSALIPVLRLLTGPSRSVALVAPALFGQFNAGPAQVVAALKKIGFDEVVEVAAGASVTAQKEAEELHTISPGHPPLMSSCCPAWMETVQKHLPQLKSRVSTAGTPMYYTAIQAAQAYPDAVRVFISPCVAKKYEAQRDGHVHHVITMEELGAILVAANVEVEQCQPDSDDRQNSRMRKFCMAGGVSELVTKACNNGTIKTMLIDGLDRKKIKYLKTFVARPPDVQFVEVMSCEGGCVAGCAVITDKGIAGKRITQSVNELPQSEHTQSVCYPGINRKIQ